METIKPAPTPGMTLIQKPVSPNTQFRPVPKPTVQEKPSFQVINLFPPIPPKHIEVDTVKPANITKPKKALKLEDTLPVVALGIIVLFVMSRNKLLLYSIVMSSKYNILHFDTVDSVGNYDEPFSGRKNGSGQNVTSLSRFTLMMMTMYLTKIQYILL